jgi:hypothetical protein
VSPPTHLGTQIPWLRLPPKLIASEDNEVPASSLCFYDPSQKTTHIFYLPAIEGKRIRGSSHGWLFLEDGRNVSLLNPITAAEVHLPYLSAQPRSFSGGNVEGKDRADVLRYGIRKAILSANPTKDPDCFVIALSEANSEAVFCKMGDSCWTLLAAEEELAGDEVDDIIFDPPKHAVDIYYRNGAVYKVHADGSVWIYDIHERNYRSFLSTFDGPRVEYILTVEGDDQDPLMVFTSFGDLYPRGDLYLCPILVFSDDEGKWLKVEAHNSILFLGGIFHCIALRAASVELNGWEGNSICYICPKSDDPNMRSLDIKIFIKGEPSSVVILSNHRCRTLMNHNFFTMFALGPDFLWLTPSLC